MSWLRLAAHPMQGKITRALNARLTGTWKRLWNQLVSTGQVPTGVSELVDQLADGILQSLLTFNQDIGGVIVQVQASPQDAFHALYTPTQPKPTLTLFVPERDQFRYLLTQSRGQITPIANSIQECIAHELVHHDQHAAGQLDHGTAGLPKAEYYGDPLEFEPWVNWFLKRLKGRTPKYIETFVRGYFAQPGMEALADKYVAEVIRRMGL